MEFRPVLGLAIAAAIPPVIFALWTEYFKNDLRSEGQEDRELSDEELMAERLSRVRLAGLLTTILQLVIFLATSPVREQSSTAAAGGMIVTLLALILQRWSQLGLERLILPALTEASTKQSEQPRLIPPAVLWGFVSMALYAGIVLGSIIASTIVVAVLRIPGAWAFGVIGAGAVLGYSLALASNFAISPWLFKKMLPSEEIREPQTLQRLTSWFSEAGVTPPEFRKISAAGVHSANAWVTGFPELNGAFRPVLWLTPKLAAEMNNPAFTTQFEAIIKHEIAHMRLRHLARRFLLAWSLSLTAIVTLAAALAFNAYFQSTNATSALPLFSMVASLFILWRSVSLIRRQAQRQELEADRFCVERLGARASALISALEILEEWNRVPNSRETLSQQESLGTHPASSERVSALQELLQKELATKSSSTIASEDRRAA
ncbi:MAG: Peptidase family [Pseudomonadota bacterium]|jgi:Zn-dependent protease with chaperone function